MARSTQIDLDPMEYDEDGETLEQYLAGQLGVEDNKLDDPLSSSREELDKNGNEDGTDGNIIISGRIHKNEPKEGTSGSGLRNRITNKIRTKIRALHVSCSTCSKVSVGFQYAFPPQPEIS